MPLRAITSFVDPHASFALKFDIATDAEAKVEAGAPDVEPAADRSGAGQGRRRGQKAPRAKRGGDKPAKAKDGEAAAVVSLDAFRKKNG